jgi:transcriptional regulator with XRE-family HTH domain
MISSSQIRAARAIINVKQSELAKASGISLATLNNIERGVGDPRASTLENIEKALANAGVHLKRDDWTDTVVLDRLSRPNAYDTYFASQLVLDALAPESLSKAEKILFFTRWTDTGHDDPPRVCLLIEGVNQAVLFDQVDFNLSGVSRVAEVAGILLAAFAYHRDSLYYLTNVFEDTTTADAPDAVDRLRRLPWLPLTQPKSFIDSFDSWEGHLTAFGERKGHPMRDLLALFS